MKENSMDEYIERVTKRYVQGYITKNEAAGMIAKEYVRRHKFDPNILNLIATPFMTEADMQNRLSKLERQINNGNRGLIKMYEHLKEEAIL
jgi:hypothetical protein